MNLLIVGNEKVLIHTHAENLRMEVCNDVKPGISP